ncbi:MAG: phosphonate ABC transporter, permease protein PhnE [Desulfarculaceae bacterium]|jgi:phosphonate transport system permease protein
MADELTLERLTPHMTPKQKALTWLMLITAFAMLVASYIATGIEPLKLYQKRENAFIYLFGKDLQEKDKKEAMRQAQRMPQIVAAQEARQEVKRQLASRTEKPLPQTMEKMVRDRTDEILANTPEAEKEELIQQEYSRILDDKRGGFFPPETAWPNLASYLAALVETIAIAIWGSLIAVVVALPVSMFAAENTLALMVQGSGPWQRFARWVSRFLVRRLLDFCRGFNEFVMALIFVAVIGLGPFAGVLALAIHTFGILGKVFSEAIEQIEPGQVEAVIASGAGPTQIMSFSVLPQVMPLIVSYSLLRFESNVRSATILGFCGAGGIGFLMFDKINGYLYREVCTMMILVIISVTIIDYLCGILRKQFV